MIYIFLSRTDLYPSNLQEWEPTQCLTGFLNVVHGEVGELQYEGRAPSDLTRSRTYFYDSFYTLPTQSSQHGKLERIPLPALDSPEWPLLDTEVIESYRTKMYNDIKCAMKPSIGARNVHLSLFVPIACFVHLFSDCKQLRKTRTTFMCKDIDEAWLDHLFDKGWRVKSSKGDDLIECRLNTFDIAFR